MNVDDNTTDSAIYKNMMTSRTIAVSIECPAAAVYDFVIRPLNFLRWLTFITDVTKSGDDWFVETSGGPMGIEFLPRNNLGVLDHYAILPDGRKMLNPMRVIPNGSGSDVLFTLFQLPGMTDEQFARDAQTVEADLKKLKSVLERSDAAT